MFWRVDHDSKGAYLSLRYYNNDPTKQGKILRKKIYNQLNSMIDNTIVNELDTLNIIYANCITRPRHGNYYENTLIHIGINSVLESWEENKGQPFIDSVRVIDSKLREVILTFDWENI